MRSWRRSQGENQKDHGMDLTRRMHQKVILDATASDHALKSLIKKMDGPERLLGQTGSTLERAVVGVVCSAQESILQMERALGSRRQKTTLSFPVSEPFLFGSLFLTFSAVNGTKVPFSQVTEEHQEAMTPEEYTAYFEVYQARN